MFLLYNTNEQTLTWLPVLLLSYINNKRSNELFNLSVYGGIIVVVMLSTHDKMVLFGIYHKLNLALDSPIANSIISFSEQKRWENLMFCFSRCRFLHICR